MSITAIVMYFLMVSYYQCYLKMQLDLSASRAVHSFAWLTSIYGTTTSEESPDLNQNI